MASQWIPFVHYYSQEVEFHTAQVVHHIIKRLCQSRRMVISHCVNCCTSLRGSNPGAYDTETAVVHVNSFLWHGADCAVCLNLLCMITVMAVEHSVTVSTACLASH